MSDHHRHDRNHDHEHAHDHHHGHTGFHHHGDGSKQSLMIAMAVTSGILLAELIGGFLTNSLALLSDAAHMLSDVAALGLSLLAIWFAGKRATLQRTFGFYRAEVLAALLNGVTLVLVSLFIFQEAFDRFRNPPEVKSGLMLAVAAVGLIANLVSAWVLSRGDSHKHNLNVRSALLHVIGDALGSVGAIGAGLIMMYTGWYYADPLVSVVIGILVLLSSWRLLRDTVHVLLEGVPVEIDVKELKQTMLEVQGVLHVHDLHVWTVSSKFISMSGHVKIHEGSDSQFILRELTQLLRSRFGLSHTTIQIETEEMHPYVEDCTHCPE